MRKKDTTIKRKSSRVLPSQVTKQGADKTEFECDLCGKVAAHKNALCRPRKIEGDDLCL